MQNRIIVASAAAFEREGGQKLLYHSYCARYMYDNEREKLPPRRFEMTSRDFFELRRR